MCAHACTCNIDEKSFLGFWSIPDLWNVWGLYFGQCWFSFSFTHRQAQLLVFQAFCVLTWAAPFQTTCCWVTGSSSAGGLCKGWWILIDPEQRVQVMERVGGESVPDPTCSCHHAGIESCYKTELPQCLTVLLPRRCEVPLSGIGGEYPVCLLLPAFPFQPFPVILMVYIEC